LISNHVEFVVTGGVAFSVYAKPRYTSDLEIVILPTKENIERFSIAFEQFGFSISEQSKVDLLKLEMKLIRVGIEPFMIDVMNFYKGVEIEELFKEKQLIPIQSDKIPFASIPHLILNKQAVGRPEDVADVNKLIKIYKS